MPTYQYACTECDHRFEQVQSFTDDALSECPVCHGRLRKVFNAVGVVFKGSGFYRTDSRASSSASEPASSGSSSEKSEKKSTGDSSGSEKKSSDSSSSSSSSSETKKSSGSEKAS